MFLSPFARLFIGGENARHDFRMRFREFPADADDVVGVEVDIAVEVSGSRKFRLRHERIQSRPGVDASAQELVLAVRMLKRDNFDVVQRESGSGERADHEDIRVGSGCCRDGFALESGDVFYRASGFEQERGPFRRCCDVNGFDRVSVDEADQRGDARGGADVNASAAQELHGFVGALAEHPAHPDAVLFQIFFEVALLTQNESDGAPVRVVNSNFGKSVSGCGVLF